jgi:hypothetical protein
VTAPTPLLDFFRRGEVARDVRLLAAAGAIAPRAHEQLSILILLLDDADREVRATAQETLDKIPADSLATFLARSDVPTGVREFFAKKGVLPAELPSLSAEEPLLDVAASGAPPAEEEAVDDQSRESLIQQIANMSFTDRLKAAMKGSREMRGILIRDPNKMISAAVLSSPKLNEAEIESFSKMTNVSEEVLRIIGTNRAWTKNYSVICGLTKNPKTPLGISLNLMARLNERDVSMLANDRNIPEPLRSAARRKVALGKD